MDASYEEASWANDELLCGIDEAGLGCLAGSLFVGYVIFPKNYDFAVRLSKVNDSKKLSEDTRFELAKLIKEDAVFWAVDKIDPDMVDERSGYHAVLDAIKNKTTTPALQNLRYSILFDGNHAVPGVDVINKFLIKGDGKCYSIAAASILAKTQKDLEMIGLDLLCPQYNWKSNKGYGTKKHEAAILENGLTEFHRKTYCKKFIQ